MTDFNRELAIALIESDEAFSVDFDEVWHQVGYASKQKAERKLRQGFKEGLDFLIAGLKHSTCGRPSKKILLTVKCLEKMKTSQESRTTKAGHEKLIQQKLYGKKGGQLELATPVGNIDLLTSSEIIEIKDKNNWKSALGQVLAYSYYYPSHRKVICLFGYAHSSYKEIVENICAKHDVYVEWVNN